MTKYSEYLSMVETITTSYPQSFPVDLHWSSAPLNDKPLFYVSLSPQEPLSCPLFMTALHTTHNWNHTIMAPSGLTWFTQHCLPDINMFINAVAFIGILFFSREQYSIVSVIVNVFCPFHMSIDTQVAFAF